MTEDNKNQVNDSMVARAKGNSDSSSYLSSSSDDSEDSSSSSDDSESSSGDSEGNNSGNNHSGNNSTSELSSSPVIKFASPEQLVRIHNRRPNEDAHASGSDPDVESVDHTEEVPHAIDETGAGGVGSHGTTQGSDLSPGINNTGGGGDPMEQVTHGINNTEGGDTMTDQNAVPDITVNSDRNSDDEDKDSSSPEENEQEECVRDDLSTNSRFSEVPEDTPENLRVSTFKHHIVYNPQSELNWLEDYQSSVDYLFRQEELLDLEGDDCSIDLALPANELELPLKYVDPNSTINTLFYEQELIYNTGRFFYTNQPSNEVTRTPHIRSVSLTAFLSRTRYLTSKLRSVELMHSQSTDNLKLMFLQTFFDYWTQSTKKDVNSVGAMLLSLISDDNKIASNIWEKKDYSALIIGTSTNSRIYPISFVIFSLHDSYRHEVGRWGEWKNCQDESQNSDTKKSSVLIHHVFTTSAARSIGLCHLLIQYLAAFQKYSSGYYKLRVFLDKDNVMASKYFQGLGFQTIDHTDSNDDDLDITTMYGYDTQHSNELCLQSFPHCPTYPFVRSVFKYQKKIKRQPLMKVSTLCKDTTGILDGLINGFTRLLDRDSNEENVEVKRGNTGRRKGKKGKVSTIHCPMKPQVDKVAIPHQMVDYGSLCITSYRVVEKTVKVINEAINYCKSLETCNPDYKTGSSINFPKSNTWNTLFFPKVNDCSIRDFSNRFLEMRRIHAYQSSLPMSILTHLASDIINKVSPTSVNLSNVFLEACQNMWISFDFSSSDHHSTEVLHDLINQGTKNYHDLLRDSMPVDFRNRSYNAQNRHILPRPRMNVYCARCKKFIVNLGNPQGHHGRQLPMFLDYHTFYILLPLIISVHNHMDVREYSEYRDELKLDVSDYHDNASNVEGGGNDSSEDGESSNRDDTNPCNDAFDEESSMKAISAYYKKKLFQKAKRVAAKLGVKNLKDTNNSIHNSLFVNLRHYILSHQMMDYLKRHKILIVPCLSMTDKLESSLPLVDAYRQDSFPKYNNDREKIQAIMSLVMFILPNPKVIRMLDFEVPSSLQVKVLKYQNSILNNAYKRYLRSAHNLMEHDYRIMLNTRDIINKIPIVVEDDNYLNSKPWLSFLSHDLRVGYKQQLDEMSGDNNDVLTADSFTSSFKGGWIYHTSEQGRMNRYKSLYDFDPSISYFDELEIPSIFGHSFTYPSRLLYENRPIVERSVPVSRNWNDIFDTWNPISNSQKSKAACLTSSRGDGRKMHLGYHLALHQQYTEAKVVFFERYDYDSTRSEPLLLSHKPTQAYLHESPCVRCLSSDEEEVLFNIILASSSNDSVFKFSSIPPGKSIKGRLDSSRVDCPDLKWLKSLWDQAAWLYTDDGKKIRAENTTFNNVDPSKINYDCQTLWNNNGTLRKKKKIPYVPPYERDKYTTLFVKKQIKVQSSRWEKPVVVDVPNPLFLTQRPYAFGSGLLKSGCSKYEFNKVMDHPSWKTKSVNDLGSLYFCSGYKSLLDPKNVDEPTDLEIKVNYILNKNVNKFYVWKSLKKASTVRSGRASHAKNVAIAESKLASICTMESVYVVFSSKVDDEASRKLMPKDVIFQDDNCTYYSPGLAVLRFLDVQLILKAAKKPGQPHPIPTSFTVKIYQLRQFEVEEKNPIATISLFSKYPRAIYGFTRKNEQLQYLSVNLHPEDHIHENDITGNFYTSSLLSVGTPSKVIISPGARVGNSNIVDKHRLPTHPKLFIAKRSSNDDFNCVPCSFYNLMNIFYDDHPRMKEVMEKLHGLCCGFNDIHVFSKCANLVANCGQAKVKHFRCPKTEVYEWIQDLNSRKYGLILTLMGESSNCYHCVACFDDEIMDSSFASSITLSRQNLSFCLGESEELSSIQNCCVILPNKYLIQRYMERFNREGMSYEQIYGEAFEIDEDYFENPKKVDCKKKKRKNKIQRERNKKRKERSQSFDY